MRNTAIGKHSNFIFKDNAFDLFRYWAAVSVMFLHYTGYVLKLTDNGAGFIKALRMVVTFFPGVVVLFSLSGYLISASYERSKNRKEFFLKRVLRMYPELWVCTIVNLMVIIALAHELLDKSIVVWLVTQIFGIANTPSCLSTFATGSVNGALWTIFVEVQLYIILGFTYKWLRNLSNKGWILLMVLLAAFNVFADYLSTNMGGAASKLLERFCLTYAIWFFVGVFCYVKKDTLMLRLRKRTPLLLLVYIIIRYLPIGIPGYYSNIAIGLLLPFIVIGGGYLLPRMRFTCDLSYEIFLYHWIVLNVIVHFDLMNRLPAAVCILIFTLVTLALAYLSWRCVGKGRKIKKIITL